MLRWCSGFVFSNLPSWYFFSCLRLFLIFKCECGLWAAAPWKSRYICHFYNLNKDFFSNTAKHGPVAADQLCWKRGGFFSPTLLVSIVCIKSCQKAGGILMEMHCKYSLVRSGNPFRSTSFQLSWQSTEIFHLAYLCPVCAALWMWMHDWDEAWFQNSFEFWMTETCAACCDLDKPQILIVNCH